MHETTRTAPTFRRCPARGPIARALLVSSALAVTGTAHADEAVVASQARMKGELAETRMGDQTVGDLFLELESVAATHDLPAGPFDRDDVAERVREILEGRGLATEDREALIELVVERVRSRHGRVSPIDASHVQVKVALTGTPLTDEEKGLVMLAARDIVHDHAGDPAAIERAVTQRIRPLLDAAGLTPSQQWSVTAWLDTWAEALTR